MTPQKPQKQLILLKTNTFGLKKMFDNMVLRYMPNSDHGGPPGTRVMTIFVFYVNPHLPNIEKNEAYGGLQIPGGSPSFFSSNFPSNAIRIRPGDGHRA